MAEKNTLSILETIKKKMNKFDEKTPKASKVGDIDSEFEYISPTKKEETPKPVEAKVAKVEFKDDLNFDELTKETPKPAPPAPTQPAKLDDFNLDDLDLDDESTKKAASAPVAAVPIAPAIPVPTQPEAVVDGDIEEDDIEDFEDEVDFEGNEQAAEIHEEGEDDLNLDEEVEEQHEESSEEDELNLDDLEESHEEKATAQPEHQEDDLNLDDLELEEEPKKQEEAKKEAASEELEDLDLDDLELEEEQSKPEVKEEMKKEDDLNLDDLELEEESQKQEAPKEEVKQEEAKQEDDFDFGDLELDEEKPSEPAAKKPEVVASPAPEFDELAELEKAEAELGLNDQAKVETKAEPLSEHDEIDLEFEKEIMGLKPEIRESASAASQQSSGSRFESVEDFLSMDAPINKAQSTMQQIPVLKGPQFNQNIPVAPQPVQQQVQAQPQMQQQQAQVSVMNAPQQSESNIFSEATMRQATDSIKKLIDAKNVVSGISSFSQGPAFSELAVQLMEPKLEKWMNENFAPLVEKIVREEIKKLIPKE